MPGWKFWIKRALKFGSSSIPGSLREPKKAGKIQNMIQDSNKNMTDAEENPEGIRENSKSMPDPVLQSSRGVRWSQNIHVNNLRYF